MKHSSLVKFYHAIPIIVFLIICSLFAVRFSVSAEIDVSVDDPPRQVVPVREPLKTQLSPVEDGQIGGYPELLQLHIPFNGAWRPGNNPLLIQPGDFADIKNMRYTDTSIEGVSGYSKINTNVVNAIYLKIRNGFHFIKDDESHVLIQVYNTLLHMDSNDQGGTALSVWGDGSFIYLANDSSGLHSYSVDGSGNLTHIDSDDQGGYAYSVWGDGSFIYLANHSGGLHSYSVDGSGNLTHIDSDDQGGFAYGVWGDGSFIYLANHSGGLHSYSVDGSGNLTHIDSDDQGGTALSVWGDGSFIYLANGAGGLHSYSVDGSGNLTHIDSDDQGGFAYGVWGDGSFIYLANGGSGLHSYSVDGSGKVYENETAIPSAGNFNASELHTDASGASKGRFSTAPQGTMVYCNGADAPQVWPGDEGKCFAFITSTAAIGNTITNPRDYTTRIQNSLSTSDQVATVGGGTAFSMLLHCDGADASTTFTDTVGTHTPVAQGNAQLDVDQFKFGTASGLFDGTGDYVTVPDHADWHMGTGAFTISGWIRFNSLDSPFVIEQRVDERHYVKLHIGGNSVILSIKDGANVVFVKGIYSPGFVVDTWYHAGFLRGWDGNANIWAVTINGSKLETVFDSDAWPNFAAALEIGRAGADWSKVADPGTLPTGTGYGAAFNHDGSLLAVAHTTPPYVTIYNTSDWSKVADPGTLPTGTIYGVAFNHDGSLLAVAHINSPYVTIYNTSDWSKVADPGTLPTGDGVGTAFNHDGSLLAVAHINSPYVTIYNPRYYFDGWFDEFCGWKGTAAWIDNFTSPNRAYTAASGYGLIGSPWRLDGMYFDISSFNTTISTITFEEYTGTAWSSMVVSDGTSSGGISCAQDGWITWPTTETTSEQKFITGYPWYWYQFYLSAGTADIAQVTVDAPMQDITNIWDGTYSVCTAARVYEATNSDYFDYTDEVNSEITSDVLNLDSLEATNDYLLLAFTERQQAIEISIPTAGSLVKGNSTANTTLTVYYNTGDAWVAVAGLYDGTEVGSISMNRSGMISWSPPSVGEEFPKGYAGEDFFYYYMLVWDQNFDAEVEVYFIQGVRATDDILPYQFSVHFQNRTILFNKDGDSSEVCVSGENAPWQFNGQDSTVFNVGADRAFTAAACLSNSYESSIDAVLIACKDSETWIFREAGDGGPNFIRQRLSDTIGCPAPLTMKAYEVAPGLNVVAWLSYDGLQVSDGVTIKLVHGIEPYFDPLDDLFVGYANLESASGFIDPLLKEYNLLIGDNWLIYDIRRDKWTKKEPPSYPECGWRVQDTHGAQYCYLGYDTGYMYRNENTNAYDGSDIDQSVTLADIPLGGFAYESQLDFLKLTVEAKNTGTNETITVKHRADGDESWSTKTGVPMYESGKRYVQHTQRINEPGVTHQFKLEVSTDDIENGFSPLSLDLFYRILRTDTAID